MSKIVVLSTIYLDIPSANGICARNLVSALRENGHEVFVVCYDGLIRKQEKLHEYIYTIPKPQSNVKHSSAQKLFRTASVAMGSTKPIINSTLAKDYYNRLCEIDEKYEVDAIIAMFFPFESVEAMYCFTKRRPKIKTIVYEIDSVKDGVANRRRFDIYDKAYNRWLKKVYFNATAIIIMNSHRNYWNAAFSNNFANKLYIADIPVLLEKKGSVTEKRVPIKMIYSGLIESRYRSPTYLLSLLKIMSKRIPFEFLFFSKGDCEEEIAIAAKEIESIKQYGYVPPDQLDKATRECDFLISIGNSISRSVPSKLITYLSYGKPIIHFSSQKDDICNSYLSKYPLALIVDQSKDIQENINVILNFIQKSRYKKVDFSSILKLYSQNCPDYSARIINDILVK